MNHADQAVRDLVHIRSMILRLERLLHDDDTGEASPVTSPDYWRSRITVLLATNLPPALEAKARVLLARLDTLSAASHSRTQQHPH
jgi:hypothetical protein